MWVNLNHTAADIPGWTFVNHCRHFTPTFIDISDDTTMAIKKTRKTTGLLQQHIHQGLVETQGKGDMWNHPAAMGKNVSWLIISIISLVFDIIWQANRLRI